MAEKSKYQKFSDITEADKKEWKAKYGHRADVVSIPIDPDIIDGEEAQFVIVSPSRKVVEAVAQYVEDKDTARANDVMLKNCVLGGDMKYLDENDGRDEIYFELLKRIGEKVKAKKSRVKKL